MEKTQLFLDRLSIIESKYRTLEEDKEQFNIFTVLHKERDEAKLHSRFLSVLLSPQSSHKKGDLFLKHFLQVLSINDFDLSSVEVYPTEYEKSEYKSIDLLIINRSSRQAIIIENKIDAGDSNHEDRGQLEGYVDKIRNKDHIPLDRIQVLFLTIDGHEPSKESLGTYKTLEKMNGKTIDYEHDILEWLNSCLRDCVSQAFLRESISQYIKLIKHMTNNIDIKERLEILNLIGSSSDNLKSAKLLIENFKHVKWHTIWNFYTELAEELKKEGYEITGSPTQKEITYTAHHETYKKGYFANYEYGLFIKTKANFNLYIWNGTSYSNGRMFWGMKKEEIPPIYENKINSFFQDCQNGYDGEANDVSKFFNLNPDEIINFSDFSCDGTFNLINSDYRNTIIKKLVKEIKSFVDQIVKD